jgi:hypothetical protein
MRFCWFFKRNLKFYEKLLFWNYERKIAKLSTPEPGAKPEEYGHPLKILSYVLAMPLI